MSFSSDDVDSEATTPLIAYDPSEFAEQVANLHETNQPNPRLLFHGGVREDRQRALGTLTRYVTGNVHQFRGASLLSAYRMQTQNNLRKAFDHAAEENALLYFDQADAVFTHRHDDTSDEEDENAVPSTLEYFFDRVAAYDGTVVLGLQRKRHVEWARERMTLVVDFE